MPSQSGNTQSITAKPKIPAATQNGSQPVKRTHPIDSPSDQPSRPETANRFSDHSNRATSTATCRRHEAELQTCTVGVTPTEPARISSPGRLFSSPGRSRCSPGQANSDERSDNKTSVKRFMLTRHLDQQPSQLVRTCLKTASCRAPKPTNPLGTARCLKSAGVTPADPRAPAHT